MGSPATDALRHQAAIDVAFSVEPASSWVIECEVDTCTASVILTARPGVSRARVIRDGKSWMTSHRLECPGGPEKRSDRK